MTQIRLANVKDLSNGDIKAFSLFGKKIGVFKDENGCFHAIDILCKHQGALLIKDDGKYTATCPLHQWKYDLLSGECLNHDSAPLRIYPTVVEGDVLFLILDTPD